jgi:alkylation response protein AidB-like acyl-CoA dehydrogenase
VKGESWVGFDRDFSLAVGAQGWIGMTWPKAYGGRERSALERHVVLEEMLAAGAPVGAHWTGDRQTGPLLLRVGTEAQKQLFLPRLARGEISVCIGLSEPDTGSDLASVRSRAQRTSDGWRLSGRKIWTTNAHRSEYMLGLFRTGEPDGRHAGLSQFLIDLSLPGVEIRGIRDLSGQAHFNEVTFDDVDLPPDALVGHEGAGWQQVMAELAFERSGPDRYMSAFPLLSKLADVARRDCEMTRRLIGEAVGDLIVLREMSLSIAGRLARGETPEKEAALVKELGVGFEQRLPEVVRAACAGAPTDNELAALLKTVTLLAPTFSLRGGTREVMLGIIAKGVGLR